MRLSTRCRSAPLLLFMLAAFYVPANAAFIQDFYEPASHLGPIIVLPEDVVIGDIVIMDLGDHTNATDRANKANWKHVLRFMDIGDVLTNQAQLFSRGCDDSGTVCFDSFFDVFYEIYIPWNPSGTTVYAPQSALGNTYRIHDYERNGNEVPEPGTWPLMFVGVAALIARRKFASV